MARRSASARINLISSSHFSSAIFGSSASVSAYNFFLKIEILIDWDDAIDSLDVNKRGVCSLRSSSQLLFDEFPSG